MDGNGCSIGTHILSYKPKKQAEVQISGKKRALAREARKARNHALMVAGGLIVNHAPCGNWKRIDWDRLAA